MKCWLQPWARPIVNRALTLAAQGYAVFPCTRHKSPSCPHGVLQATHDPDEVFSLWKLYGGPLIGVATGTASGIDVLDLDTTRHVEAQRWWADNQHRIPTRMHRTRSGGLHLLFGHVDGLHNSAGKIAIGIDVRSDGGYVIDWPSAGFPIVNDAPPAPWPGWLLDELQRRPDRRTTAVACGTASGISRGQLNGLARVLAFARQGQRNSVLFWAACRIAEAGADNSNIAVLREAARRTGLDDGEINATISSAMKRRAR